VFNTDQILGTSTLIKTLFVPDAHAIVIGIAHELSDGEGCISFIRECVDETPPARISNLDYFLAEVKLYWRLLKAAPEIPRVIKDGDNYKPDPGTIFD
jgi:hypothetical protein